MINFNINIVNSVDFKNEILYKFTIINIFFNILHLIQRGISTKMLEKGKNNGFH